MRKTDILRTVAIFGGSCTTGITAGPPMLPPLAAEALGPELLTIAEQHGLEGVVAKTPGLPQSARPIPGFG